MTIRSLIVPIPSTGTATEYVQQIIAELIETETQKMDIFIPARKKKKKKNPYRENGVISYYPAVFATCIGMEFHWICYK